MKKTISLLLCSICCLLLSPRSWSQDGKPLLNHIAVYVTDLKSSTDFYMEVVGLDTIPEPFHDGRHTWFGLSSSSHLHLIKGDFSPMQHNKNNHLCFSVPSLEAVISRLDKNKIGYESWAGEQQAVTTRVDGVRQLYFRDPDGYWIEINNDYPNGK